ncbi:hypothetical protein D3C72_1892020 [compost metagenome]
MSIDLLQFVLQCLLVEILAQQGFGFVGILSQAKRKHKAALIAIDHADGRLHRAAGIQPGTGLAG